MARADAAKDKLSAATAVHVERETIRQRETSSLRTFSNDLASRLSGLYDRFNAQRRDAATRQEADDEKILCLKAKIEESQVRASTPGAFHD